jgi:hypothetical protein
MLNQILSELQTLKSLIVSKENSWLPKNIMVTLTGLKSSTLNNMVSQGKIVKKGSLYSYRSYLEYCEIFPKRGNSQKQPRFSASPLPAAQNTIERRR